MTKITSMRQLRDRVLKTFEDLEEGRVDIAQAVTIAKLNETITAGLKSEMQYAVLTNQQPYIPFFERNDQLKLSNDKN